MPLTLHLADSGPDAQTKVIKTGLTEPDDGMKVNPLLMYPSTPDRDSTCFLNVPKMATVPEGSPSPASLTSVRVA